MPERLLQNTFLQRLLSAQLSIGKIAFSVIAEPFHRRH